MPLTGLQFPPTNWPGGRYSLLLAALVLMFAVAPFLHGSLAGRVVWDLFMVLVLLSGTLALGSRRAVRTIAVCIVGVELLGMGLGWLVDTEGSLGGGLWGTLRGIAAMIFFGYMAAVIFSDLIRTERISGDAICGAMCIYLMLGLLWAFAYLLIAHFVPNSFEVGEQFVAITSPQESGETFSLMTYFSFTTLTTLGYGDISPISPIARTACWLEAITGQLFLATFVAGLVGVHVAHRLQQQQR